jgi:hypothetical protein
MACYGIALPYGDYEVYGLLACNAMYFRDSLMFQRNISPPSSGSESKPSKKPAEAGNKQSF